MWNWKKLTQTAVIASAVMNFTCALGWGYSADPYSAALAALANPSTLTNPANSNMATICSGSSPSAPNQTCGTVDVRTLQARGGQMPTGYYNGSNTPAAVTLPQDQMSWLNSQISMMPAKNLSPFGPPTAVTDTPIISSPMAALPY